ncbi:AraC family transcriptional regulator [Evansella tamaricis]|uniref:AraC family transcriptional regulator n=1 Tax=Evansella tamaricis TaxID=2069301 RepID=A0ABS6JGT2_9BACI|nr:AraC family transcriptional regulator [Evansella tamaricis]MBU9712605.1 AraC family transcriptional regulator [Evansella tamaricis]
MEIKYPNENENDIEAVTNEYSVNEFFFPDMKIGFELYRMHLRSAKSTWEYPVHEHPLYEINLVTKGEQHFHVKGNKYVLQEGDLVLVRPGDLHSSSGAGNTEVGFTYFCVHFNVDDKLLLPYFKETTEVFYPVHSKLNRSIRPLLDRLMTFSENPTLLFKDKMNMHSIMFELLGMVVSCLEEEQDEDFEKISDRTFRVAYQIADKIDEFIRTPGKREDYVEESVVRIEEIADQLDFSVSYCNKVFKKVFKMSPRQYVTFRKLNESKSLLIQDKYSVEQIAFMMGYHDASHFSRQFKRWTGISPSQYRQKQRTAE